MPTTKVPQDKLAFDRLEVCQLLGISTVTLWRLEKQGRIRSVSGVGVKIYPRAEIERFLTLPPKTYPPES